MRHQKTDQNDRRTYQIEKGAVAVSALVFAFGTLLSRILGLIRDMMLARYFPTDVRDAFVNAFRLPNLFRRIFGEGALSASFIPVFISIIRGKEAGVDPRARELICAVFSILLSVTSTISLLAIVFMDDILSILLSGSAYMAVEGKFELTVYLARIMFAFLVLITLYAFFMAIHHGLRRFIWSALAPCLFNIAVIIVARMAPKLSFPEAWLAWSVLVGGFLQMAILIPVVVKSGYFPRPTLKWNQPEVLRVFKAAAPSVFGLSILQLTTIVNMYFASHLPRGSHTYLYLADRILELPLSLFVVSIGSALLPTLAEFWARGDREAMSETINHYVRLILFVSLPAAVGMFVLAHPITEVLFMGREFTYQDTLATAQIIQIISISVVLTGGVRLLAQGFYAIENTWFPALAAGVALVAHILLAYALTRAFSLPGLALASVLSSLVNLVMLGTAYHSWVGSLQFKELGRSILKFTACAIVMVIVLHLILQTSSPVTRALGGRLWIKSSVLFATVGVAVVSYMVAAHFLRVPEYHETLATFITKFKNRTSRKS